MSVTIANRSGLTVFYQFCRVESSARRQSIKIGPIRILKAGEQAIDLAPTGLTEYKLGFSFGMTYTPLVSKPLLSVAYDPEMVCTPDSTLLHLPFDEFGAPVPNYAVNIDKSTSVYKPSVKLVKNGSTTAMRLGGGIRPTWLRKNLRRQFYARNGIVNDKV